MGNIQHKIAVPVSSDSILKASLLELKQQLVNVENIVEYNCYDLLLAITKLREQTLDFLQSIEAPVNAQLLISDGQSSSSALDQVSVNGVEKEKGPYQNIVIKVSNHHYVPKLLHAQTIFTYKTDTNNSF